MQVHNASRGWLVLHAFEDIILNHVERDGPLARDLETWIFIMILILFGDVFPFDLRQKYRCQEPCNYRDVAG